MAGSILRMLGVVAAAFVLAVSSARAQSACSADLDGDGIVDARDLSTVLSNWGPCAACGADTNGDGFVDAVDLSLVLNRWGGTCAPTATGLTPAAGPIAGGVTVTITGDRLLNATSVTFGGTPATILSSTRSAVSVIAPARPAGAASISVLTQGGSVNAGSFTYYAAPSITGVTPNAGGAAGGNTVSISGANFYGAPAVRFGKASAPSVTVVSPTQLSVVAPPGTVGSTVPISVTTASGAADLPNAFAYIPIVVPSWATLIEAVPDPAIVTSATLRSAIVATGWAWRVRDNASQIEMLLVPPGTFNMGCSASNSFGCNSDENPVRAVTLTNAFYIGRYEVTQAQWTARMGSNPSSFQSASAQVPAAQVPNRPVETVSWNTVQGFLSSTGLRLPTEAEWEYAYRAGTTTAFHSMPGFPNGTNSDTQVGNIAWFGSNSVSQTRPVGGKAANALGLHDMPGNVDEWVGDWYGNYVTGPQTDPAGPVSGTTKVVRGSYWGFSSDGMRASDRAANPPSSGFNGTGFRVARNP